MAVYQFDRSSGIITMTEPLASEDWKMLRQIVIERDDGQCVECHASLQPHAVHVHHLIPRSAGGRDVQENLVSLCEGCHAGKHLNLQVGLSRRLIEHWSWRLARLLNEEVVGTQGGNLLGTVMRLLGVERLRPGQLEIILAALQGKSILFVSPTGSGKSLCFQAPTLIKNGTALVISPLKALMVDQVRDLHGKRIPSSFINGDLAPGEKRQRYSLLRRGAFKFLYCAPERFNTDMVRAEEVRAMEAIRPTFFVIDEAHCIDKWGDAFRPSYRALGQVRERLERPPVLAFTATAGPRTRQRILEALGIPDAHVVIQDVDRPNISLARLPQHDEQERLAVIQRLSSAMSQTGAGKTMIFAPTIKRGEQIADYLNANGLPCEFFHGRLRPNERQNLQGRFDGRLEPPIDVMICTSAFGMGIDVPDVRLVMHWQHPPSVEDYLQEFGRAGRDGKPSIAVVFEGSPEDEKLLKWMCDRSLEASNMHRADLAAVRREKHQSVDEIAGLTRDSKRCFRTAIRASFGDEDRTSKRAFSIWLLERVFSASRKRTAKSDCCDVCVRAKHATEVWVLGLMDKMRTEPRG